MTKAKIIHETYWDEIEKNIKGRFPKNEYEDIDEY